MKSSQFEIVVQPPEPPPPPVVDHSWIWTGVLVPIVLAWIAFKKHKN